jgi:hypothetical protein
MRLGQRSVLFGCSSLVALIVACSNPFATGREVRLYIRELQTPLTVRASGPLDAVAVVYVGGCVSFRRFQIARNGPTVQVTAVGHDAGGRGVSCPADIRDESKAMRIYGTFADSLILSARQPDGTTLRRRVIVQSQPAPQNG